MLWSWRLLDPTVSWSFVWLEFHVVCFSCWRGCMEITWCHLSQVHGKCPERCTHTDILAKADQTKSEIEESDGTCTPKKRVSLEPVSKVSPIVFLYAVRAALVLLIITIVFLYAVTAAREVLLILTWYLVDSIQFYVYITETITRSLTPSGPESRCIHTVSLDCSNCFKTYYCSQDGWFDLSLLCHHQATMCPCSLTWTMCLLTKMRWPTKQACWRGTASPPCSRSTSSSRRRAKRARGELWSTTGRMRLCRWPLPQSFSAVSMHLPLLCRLKV